MIEIHVMDAEQAALLEPHQIGQIYAERDGEAWIVTPLVRPGLSYEWVQSFCEFVESRVQQLLDVGAPHYLGWYPSAHVEGRWHITCAVYDLPDLEG